MTHLIIAIDGDTYIHMNSSKSPEEIRREIELGVFNSPIPLADPAAVLLRDYILTAERDRAPLLSRNQRNVLDLLAQGASETEIARAMNLTYHGVRYHIDSLKTKFSVQTREELITVYCRLYNR